MSASSFLVLRTWKLENRFVKRLVGFASGSHFLLKLLFFQHPHLANGSVLLMLRYSLFLKERE